MQIRARNFALSIAAALIAGGAVTGGAMQFLAPKPQTAAEPAAAGLRPELARIEQVLTTLEQNFYKPVQPDQIVEGAIAGMMKSLDDPYSDYLSVADTQRFVESVESSFEGIGSEIRDEDGRIIIVSPYRNTPSERAGLKPNDIILSVNGISLAGMKAAEAVTHLRGPKGSEVKLTIQRPGLDSPFEVVLIRDTIPIETVSTEMLPGQLGHIRIDKFAATTETEFANALNRLKVDGAKGLIIDVRQNPGGVLSAAVPIAEHLIPKGRLILQVRYRDGEKDLYGSENPSTDLPFVVLTDGGSASAAEIVAGAWRDSAGALLIGETTFGKGTVQSTEELPDGASVKYTIAEWLTPKGYSITKVGLKPDIEVKLPDYANLPYPVVEREYRQGEYAPVIGTVQQMLKALGYDPGRTDGYVDDQTITAMHAFQRANGAPESDTVAPNMVAQMITHLQELIKKNDNQLAKAQEVLQELIQKR